MHNIALVRLLDEQLVWYAPGAAESPRPLEAEEDHAALRATLAQQRWTLAFAAPAAQVRLLQLDVTPEEKKHLNQSLPFMLEEQVAEDIEHLHFAAAPVDKLRYVVAVCDRESMAAWEAILEPLGALVSHWVPEQLLLPWQAGEWCLLVEVDRALLRTGESQGFGCECDLLPVLLASAGAEPAPESLVVYGEDQQAELALLPEHLRPLAQWRRGNLCSALLLSEGLPALNLRQGRYAPQLPLGRWWREWRVVAGVFAAVFCLQLLATFLDWRAAAAQNLALRAATEASFRQVNPRGAMVDAEKQLQRQLNELRGAGPGGGFLPLLASVGEVLDKESGTLLASLNYSARAGEMRMNIVADDFAAVERVRAGINGTGLAAVLESSSAQDSGVRARLRVGDSP